MAALRARFDDSEMKRIPRKWWWIRPRYEILINLDDVKFQSDGDYWTRFEILMVAGKRRSFFFALEAFDKLEYEKVC